jgi:hypothetical protein
MSADWCFLAGQLRNNEAGRKASNEGALKKVELSAIPTMLPAQAEQTAVLTNW